MIVLMMMMGKIKKERRNIANQKKSTGWKIVTIILAVTDEDRPKRKRDFDQRHQ